MFGADISAFRVTVTVLIVIICKASSVSEQGPATVTPVGHHSGVWAVKFKPSTGKQYEQIAEEYATQHDLINRGAVGELEDTYEFVLSTKHQSMLHKAEFIEGYRNRLLLSDHVNWCEHQRVLTRARRTVIFNDPGYKRQWHLHNKDEPLHDLNITTVWSYNITGHGVTVCVVDDGVEQFNPDIKKNFNKDGSYDFTDNDIDPSPTANNSHGTRCAGLIAAVANNGICGVGVAYGARVSGIRMLDGVVTDIKEAKSFGYRVQHNDIFSCSWGPEDDGKQADGPGVLANEILQKAVKKGRHGYGNIFVVASGNGGRNNDDCNYDGYANSPYTITIGAINEHNSLPYYGEPCSAIFAVTYSSGASYDRYITTTDITRGRSNGGCTNMFSGTSAAAPLAAGVLSLVLQVRSCVTWRDVQHLIVYTAVKVDAAGATWVRNTARFHHSREHGFGRLDAFRITMAAKVWPLVPQFVTWTSHEVTGGGIPKKDSSLVSNLTVRGIPSKMMSLEHVLIDVKVTHTCRGVLQFELVSPGNTKALLAEPRYHDCSSEILDWTFSTVMFWGETDINGVWQLITKDTKSYYSSGEVLSWKLVLWGTSISKEGIMERQRLIENVVNKGVNESSWIKCPRPRSGGDDILYKDYSIYYTVFQYAVALLCIIIVVWLGDAALRYSYHKLCHMWSSRASATPVVRYRRDDGEEGVSLLDETSADIHPTNTDEKVVTFAEILEHDQL